MSLSSPPLWTRDQQTNTTVVGPEASGDYCRRLTKAQARNFYYGLRLLPEPRRSGMYALYAYMRLTDDIADDGRPAHLKLADLGQWERLTREICGMEASADPVSPLRTSRSAVGEDHPIWPAFREMVGRFNVPPEVFTDAIEGQRRDLLARKYRTFEELREYCRLVAGVVGVGSIHIWGFTGGAETERLALALGEAFQLTNILRDLREDATLGRTYFPADDLAAFDLTEADLRKALAAEQIPANVQALLREYISRAQRAYDEAAPLASRITPECRPTLVAMTSIYHGLLCKIALDPGRVLRERVSLSIWTKLRIGWRASRK